MLYFLLDLNLDIWTVIQHGMSVRDLMESI